MAKQVWSGATLVVGPYELSTDVDGFMVDASAAALDSTNFGSNGWREVEGGERMAKAQFEGFVADDNGTKMGYLDDIGGSTPVPIIVTDTASSAAGDDAVLLEDGLITSFTRGGSVNQLAEFMVNIDASGFSGGGFYGGTITAATSSSTTTGINAGAVAAGQYLVSILSVSSAATGTLDVVLESDADNTFASATTRITHTQATTSVTAEALNVAGAITDTWYRWNYTIGSSGTYTFRVALAIVTP